VATTVDELEVVISYCETHAAHPEAQELAASAYWRVAELARAERDAILELAETDPDRE
jgi:hypothetical protein